MEKIKKFIKSVISPAVASPILNTQNLWWGHFESWDAALANSDGYDSEVIFEKCKNALLKVKNGEAIYERDSVLFDKIQYAWALLACLQNIALANNKKLCVIDFGGSLGTTYYQNRFFLKDVDLSWIIVEQPQFVDSGRNYFQNNVLRFEYSLEDALSKYKVDCLILSSVLQYLPNPFDLIKKILSYKIKNILIDRTGFISGNDDVITVQSVSETIYKSSYPCWFFNEEKFVRQLLDPLELVADFNDAFTAPYTSESRLHYWKGFYFRMNE